MSEIADRSVSQITVRDEKPKHAPDLFEKKLYYEERDFYETRSKNLIGKKCLIKSSNNI